jgi:RNA polymerase sigma-70 factor (ECF subfamily)
MSRVPRPRPQAAGRTIDIESVVRESYRDAWLLCRHLSDAQSADDLTQETFLRVQKALPGFRSDASVKTWVLSIARRTCADAIRRQNREHRKTSRLRDELWAGGATHVPDVADSVSLWALVSQLEVERRAAFVLTQFFGLSYDEAAIVCDCPVGTIRSRIARARSDLIDAQAGDALTRRTNA